MSEETRRRDLPHPGPLDERGAAVDARIRMKLRRGEPLSRNEGAFLSNMPGRREISAEEVQASAAREGGVPPIDALTGLPHVARPADERDDRDVRPRHDGALDAA